MTGCCVYSAGVTERFNQLHVNDNEKNESVYASCIERSTNADEDVDDEVGFLQDGR